MILPGKPWPLPIRTSSPWVRAATPGSAKMDSSRRRSIDHPTLWSVDSPNLYTAIVTVKSGGKVRDAERITFGVRTVRFDADHGFFLNGQP